MFPLKDDVAHSISSHRGYCAGSRHPTFRLIDPDPDPDPDPGPKSNGRYPKATGRDFKPSWFVVAVVVTAIIILAVWVHL